MKYLLLLLLPCLAWAGDCKVHRPTPHQAQWCEFDTCGVFLFKVAPCQHKAHYIDTCAFTVREKCDTTWWGNGWFGYEGWRVKPPYQVDSLSIHCYPDTIWKAVDSLPRGNRFGEIVLSVETTFVAEPYRVPYQLDSTELSILREMIEWFKHKDEPKVWNLPGLFIRTDSINCDLLDRSRTK